MGTGRITVISNRGCIFLVIARFLQSICSLLHLQHFEDEKIPIHESLVTQCCSGIGMVVLIQ